MVNWSLAMQPNAFDRYRQEGYALSMQARQMRQQEERQNALASYAMKPNEAGFNALAMAAPEVAIQVQGQRQEQAREAQLQDVRQRAFSGDQTALQELARLDPQEATSIANNRRQYEAGMVEAASNVAQRILTLPPEQRAQAFEQQITILSQRFPELGQYRGQYSDDLMQSTIAEAGQWHQFNQSQQPDYMAIPEGGTLVDTRNPQAVQQFGGAGQMPSSVPSGSPLSQPAPRNNVITYDDFRNRLVIGGAAVARQELQQSGAVVAVQTPDEARTLPSGTRILLPDGTEGRVP